MELLQITSVRTAMAAAPCSRHLRRHANHRGRRLLRARVAQRRQCFRKGLRGLAADCWILWALVVCWRPAHRLIARALPILCRDGWGRLAISAANNRSKNDAVKGAGSGVTDLAVYARSEHLQQDP